jgi:hypothetical protein
MSHFICTFPAFSQFFGSTTISFEPAFSEEAELKPVKNAQLY